MSMTVDVYAVTEEESKRLLSDFSAFENLVRYDNSDSTVVSLEKSWHGIFYLLTGEAWEPTSPFAVLINGGTEVPESDSGYGPARLLSPIEASTVKDAISEIDDEAFWSHFDPKRMTELGIYQEIWDEPEADLREEYTFYFESLKELISGAATKSHGLLVYMV